MSDFNNVNALNVAAAGLPIAPASAHTQQSPAEVHIPDNGHSYSYYLQSLFLKMGAPSSFGLNKLHSDPAAKVADGVYIGSVAAALEPEELKRIGAHVIVNLSGYNYYPPAVITMINIPVLDTAVTLATAAHYMSKFRDAADQIRLARARGYTVLVHCAAGINRSATAIGFYLLDCGLTVPEAVEAIFAANKQRQKPALVNDTFTRLLCMRYAEIAAEKSSD